MEIESWLVITTIQTDKRTLGRDPVGYMLVSNISQSHYLLQDLSSILSPHPGNNCHRRKNERENECAACADGCGNNVLRQEQIRTAGIPTGGEHVSMLRGPFQRAIVISLKPQWITVALTGHSG